MNEFENILSDLNMYKEGDSFIQFSLPLLKTNLRLLGVKTPNIKKIAKKYSNTTIDGFIRNYSYETNFIYISNLFLKANSIDECFEIVMSNVDLIDTWALTDSTYKYIKCCKSLETVEESIDKFLKSNKEFVIRYGFLLLFEYAKNIQYTKIILNKIFDSEYFYVTMVEAWLISVCAVYNYEDTFNYLLTSTIKKETKLKAISKCVDSFRISSDQKCKLKELRKLLKVNF